MSHALDMLLDMTGATLEHVILEPSHESVVLANERYEVLLSIDAASADLEWWRCAATLIHKGTYADDAIYADTHFAFSRSDADAWVERQATTIERLAR